VNGILHAARDVCAYWRARILTLAPRTTVEVFRRRDGVHPYRRRKSGPYQSAMSMLNFYINRGGSNLPATRKRVLERAKAELRKAFHREG
jgi:hypothetical protein